MNMESKRKKILYVVSGLRTGGAEMMLWKLVSRLDPNSFDPVVVSLGGLGRPYELIRELGIRIHSMGMTTGMKGGLYLAELLRIVKNENPDLIQGWMYHGNIAATVTRSILRMRVPPVWSIRHTFYRWSDYGARNAFFIKAGAILSHSAKCVIYNSQKGKDNHISIGYSKKNALVISNGFDCEEYKPAKPNEKERIRRELGVPVDANVIGLIARYNPMKDHATFFASAGMLARRMSNVSFVLVGHGINESNEKLVRMISSSSLNGKVYLLGEREDIPRITGCLDIATCSSAWGEGFSNSIGEAMACGVPCVVTNVGDSGRLVGDSGIVVSPRDPAAMAQAWERILIAPLQKRSSLGEEARSRILKKFSLRNICELYELTYLNLLAGQAIHQSMAQ